MLRCPHCWEKDEDKLVGMGENMLLCESCDKYFSELDAERSTCEEEEMQNM